MVFELLWKTMRKRLRVGTAKQSCFAGFGLAPNPPSAKQARAKERARFPQWQGMVFESAKTLLFVHCPKSLALGFG